MTGAWCSPELDQDVQEITWTPLRTPSLQLMSKGIFQGAECGFQHCQPPDTIVPYKEIQKIVVTWFKFLVEEGIKEYC